MEKTFERIWTSVRSIFAEISMKSKNFMRSKISWLDRNLSKNRVSNERGTNKAKIKRLGRSSRRFPRKFLLTSKIWLKEVWMMTCSTISLSILS